MGYIYRGGYSSSYGTGACVGSIDTNGYVYAGGYKSSYNTWECIGKVDRDGHVYRGEYKSSYNASECIGKVENDGHIYRGEYRSSYSPSECIGKVENDGYVYRVGYNITYTAGNCAGKVEAPGWNLEAGAALLLFSWDSISVKPPAADNQQAFQQSGQSKQSQQTRQPQTSKQPQSQKQPEQPLKLEPPYLLIFLLILFSVACILMGLFVPYDIVFGNDVMGFAEYGVLFIFTYILSIIPILISTYLTYKDGKYHAVYFLIVLYAIPEIMTVTGGIIENNIASVILAFIPALIPFAFPAFVCLLLGGIAWLISPLRKKTDIDKKKRIPVLVLVFVIFAVISVLAGKKLFTLSEAEERSINEMFHIISK